MPAPTSDPGQLRPDLQTPFEQFDLEADRQGFIGHQVFPVSDVGQAGGKFPKVKLESLLRDADTSRAPRTGYGRDDWEWEKDSYATEEYGWEGVTDENEAATYASWMDYSMVVARRTLDTVLRHAERRIAAAVFDASTWTGSDLNTSVDNEWNDFTNATPITDVKKAKKKVFEACGFDANALVINRDVFDNLKDCEEVIDRIASSGAGDSTLAGKISRMQLALAMELDHIIVAGSAKNTAKKGQDRKIARIWSGEYAMVCRVAVTPDFSEPCIGRILHWPGDGSEIDCAFESYHEPQTRAEVIRYRHQVDEKQLYVECGHLLDNITDPTL